jgi:hypothetical protein
MKIYLKGCFTILGRIDSNAEKQRLHFSVPFENNSEVKVDVIPSENSVESFHEKTISKKMFKILQSDIYDGSKLSSQLQIELSEINVCILQATRKVLNLIKYSFNQSQIEENLFSSKEKYWSLDETEWKRLPVILSSTVDILSKKFLNENSAEIIQKYLNTELNPFSEPFFALRTLHKAKEERNSRYKWIDATIAAELAIKEFLTRFIPKIETLLLEVPSPPLHKLYGSILESFTSVRSPKLKELQNGAEVRNKLVHGHKNVVIESEKANQYVHDVEAAIYHLLTLLYPNDLNIKKLYNSIITSKVSSK